MSYTESSESKFAKDIKRQAEEHPEDFVQPTIKVDPLTGQETVNPDFVGLYGNIYNTDPEHKFNPVIQKNSQTLAKESEITASEDKTPKVKDWKELKNDVRNQKMREMANQTPNSLNNRVTLTSGNLIIIYGPTREYCKKIQKAYSNESNKQYKYSYKITNDTVSLFDSFWSDRNGYFQLLDYNIKNMDSINSIRLLKERFEGNKEHTDNILKELKT